MRLLQSGFAINLEKVGDVLMAENKTPQALRIYQQTLAFAEHWRIKILRMRVGSAASARVWRRWVML